MRYLAGGHDTPPTLLARSGQRLVHELLLGEAQPPLARFAVLAGEDPLAHPDANLLAQLLQVLLHQVRLGRAGRLRVHRIQREARLARDVKLGDGQRVHLLQALVLVRAALQPLQALGDVQRNVDQHPVHLGLDLVRAEEHVRLEVVQRLVDNVLLDAGVGRGRTAGLRSQRQNRHIAHGLGVILDLGMISLKSDKTHFRHTLVAFL